MFPQRLKNLLTNKMLDSFVQGESFINRSLHTYSNIYDGKKLKVLDVGCGDGEITKSIVKNVPNVELYGIDIVKCKNKSVKFKKCDLENEKFPFDANTFDVVYSNQVIEHILDKDRFLEECRRILKKGSLFLAATENISSLDNIISLLLGQEPLSQLSSGSKRRVNSILSPNFGEDLTKNYDHRYGHKNICSYFSLVRMAKLNGFSSVKIKSFGNVNRLFEKLLPFYNRIIVVYGTKK